MLVHPGDGYDHPRGGRPLTVSALFDAEDDADRFIRQYAEQYGIEDASYFEKYSDDFSGEGQEPGVEETDSERSDSGGTEHADVDGVRSQNS